jgi:glycerol kinase
MKAVVAVDQGSSSTRSIAFSLDGTRLAEASIPVRPAYPRAGWVEYDAEELWRSAEHTLNDCLAQLPRGCSVEAIGVTNQRESILVWDRRTGLALGPCVSWQCRRGAEICRNLEPVLSDAEVRAATGLWISPAFSASKLRWLLDHLDDGWSGEVCAGTIDSWIAWKLTGGTQHICDYGNASRTLLFDTETCDWSPALLSLFSIPSEILPTPSPSAGRLGTCTAVDRLAGVPLTALVGDSHAAFFVSFLRDPAAVKVTMGTGSSVIAAAPPGAVTSSNQIARSIVWYFDSPRFALEGNIMSAGATLDWAANLLGCASVGRLERLARLARLDSSVAIWPPKIDDMGMLDGSGVVSGFDLGTGRREFARAAFTSVSRQVVEVIEAMLPLLGRQISSLVVDGGATRSNLLLELQAEAIGLPVIRSSETNASALGAAYLAGLGAGCWTLDDLRAMPRRTTTVHPTGAPPGKRQPQRVKPTSSEDTVRTTASPPHTSVAKGVR